MPQLTHEPLTVIREYSSLSDDKSQIIKKFDTETIKKILFIVPPTFNFGDFVASSPTNIATIASYLEGFGYETKVIDACVDKIEFGHILELVKNYKPDLVALACNFSTLHNPSVIMADMIKKGYKNIPIVVGGNHATAVPELILKNSKIDFVVIGEAEVVFPDLLEGIKNKKDLKNIKGLCINTDFGPVRTPPANFFENLDNLPLPDYKLFNMNKYPIYNINSARGCIFRCTYCASGVIYKRQYRIRSASHVIKEIDYLLNNFGKKPFWFSDDLFGQNHQFVQDFCTTLIKNHYNIEWSVVTRASTVSLEHLKLMKAAGCTGLSVGIESGDDEMLKVMKKDTNVDSYIRIVPIVKKILRVRGFFLIGNIGESKKHVWNTFKLIKKIKPDYGTFCPVVPLPGTEIYDQLINMGIIQPEKLNWDKFYGIDHDGNYDDESLKTTSSWCNLSPKQIRDYCNYGNMLCLLVSLSPIEVMRRMKRDGIKLQMKQDKDKIKRLMRLSFRSPRAFLKTCGILLFN